MGSIIRANCTVAEIKYCILHYCLLSEDSSCRLIEGSNCSGEEEQKWKQRWKSESPPLWFLLSRKTFIIRPTRAPSRSALIGRCFSFPFFQESARGKC